MSYSYEDYVAYYKYYYGEQYGTYYAQQAAAAAGVQVGVAAAAPPPPNSQNTGYPTAYPPMGSRPSGGAGAPPHLSTQYPPPSSYQPSSRPGGGGGGGGGGERQAPKRPWGQIGTGGLGYQGSRDKKAKKPPVPSVTCKICDVTVSSQQVYESHLAGKAHKKKASQVKSGRSQETVWKPEKSESGNTFAAIPPPDQAAAVVQKPGTGVIISGAPVEAGGSGPKVSIVTPEDTFSPDRRQQQQQQPSTKSRNKPQKAKKRKGFGFGSGGGEDGEQEVFQCELCNITVNSQQQLDMHLTGAKHKKCVESNKRSQDPAVQAKLKAAAELTAAAEVRKANPETANTDKKDRDFEARSQLSSQPSSGPPAANNFWSDFKSSKWPLQIWTGDFNALTREDYSDSVWEDISNVRRVNSWESPQVKLTNKIKADHGMVDCWELAGKPGPIKTCRFDTRIDYIYASPSVLDHWELVAVETIDDPTSDHNLVIATFQC